MPQRPFLFLFFFCSFTMATLSAQTTRYVKSTATGTADGSSWANASADPQAMINASAVGDAVWISAGTYKPTQDPFGNPTPSVPREKTFYVKDGVKIYGGFVGTETAIAQRNITSNTTILSGDIGTASVTDDNCHHVVLASANLSTGVGVTIDGFFIEGGYADGEYLITVNGNDIFAGEGGGLFAIGGTNTLTNNTIYNNYAYYNGGGLIAYIGTNILSNNTIYDNTVDSGGGGVYSWSSTNTFVNNTIYSNYAPDGGGMKLDSCINTLTNNTFVANTSFQGGGVNSYLSTNTFINNIFWANAVSGNTSALSADYFDDANSSTATFTNNLLQLASTNYNTTNFNALGTASGNVFEQNPFFWVQPKLS